MPVVLPKGKKYPVCLTFDFDAISVWLGAFNATSPSYISRGEYGARCGVPRILDILARHKIKTTFFIPGHTVETYPEVCASIYKAGHEIGHHNYCHESPNSLNYEEEVKIVEKGIRAIEELTGKPPVGYRSPAWDLSPNTLNILADHGFKYESSLMADDRPYWCRLGDKVSKDAPYVFGRNSRILELPVNWALDDFWRFEFVMYPVPPLIMGVNTPDQVFDMWTSEFDYQYKNVKGGVFNIVCHPQVIGRGHRIVMLEKFVSFIERYEGVWFAKCQEIADAWKDEDEQAKRKEEKQLSAIATG
jgi:peptidoglycan/xylan/chitin deacetylase (PgdA/CDA1 family)